MNTEHFFSTQQKTYNTITKQKKDKNGTHKEYRRPKQNTVMVQSIVPLVCQFKSNPG